MNQVEELAIKLCELVAECKNTDELRRRSRTTIDHLREIGTEQADLVVNIFHRYFPSK